MFLLGSFQDYYAPALISKAFNVQVLRIYSMKSSIYLSICAKCDLLVQVFNENKQPNAVNILIVLVQDVIM